MKKLYSFLLLTLVAVLGFSAQADVTVKFTDPGGVNFIAEGYEYGSTVPYSGGELTWTSPSSAYIAFNSEVEVKSVSYQGNELLGDSNYVYPGTSYKTGSELPALTIYMSDIKNAFGDGGTLIINDGGDSGSGSDVPSNVVRFQFTNPSAVTAVYKGYFGGTPVQLTDGYVDWTEDMGSLAFGLEDVYAMTGIVDKTNGYTLVSGDDYDVSPYNNSVIVYFGQIVSSKIQLGDLVVIDNGEDTTGGGGDSGVPSDVVRFQFTNPSAVTGVYQSYFGGTPVQLTDGYVDWTEDMGSLAFGLEDVYAMTDIVDKTNGYTLVSGDDYDVSPYNNSVIVYFGQIVSSKIQLGDLVVIDNGEDTSGGGGTEPEPDPVKWTYTFNSADELSFNMSSSITYVRNTDNNTYTLTLPEGASGTIEVSAGGDLGILRIADQNGRTLESTTYNAGTVNERTIFFLPIDEYPESTTFDVTFGCKYTFTSSQDWLNFSGQDVNAVYEDGQYTVEFAGNSITATLKSEYQQNNRIYSVSNKSVSGSVSVSDGQTFTVTVNANNKSGYTYGVVYSANYTVKGPEGLVVKLGTTDATYDAGVYTFSNIAETSTRNLTVSVDPANTALQLNSVTYNGKGYTPVDGTVTIPYTDLVVTATSATANTTGGIVFIVDDQARISQITNQQWASLGEFTDNRFVYFGTSDIVFSTPQNAKIEKITKDSFDGTPVSTQEVMGATMVLYSSLTKGATYYITTSGGSTGGGDDEGFVYTFIAPEALAFSCYGTELNVSYADGAYKVSGMQPDMYQSITVTPTQGTIVSIEASDGTKVTNSGYGWFVSVDAYTTSTTFTVTMEGVGGSEPEPEPFVYTFIAPEVLSFSCYGATLDVNYADGAYTVSGMTLDMYQSIEVTATEGTIEKIEDSEGVSIEPTYGHWMIQVDSYPTATIFTVTMKGADEPEREAAVWTFNVASDVLTFVQNGNDALEVSAYADGAYKVTGIEFNPTLTVTAAEGYEFETFAAAEESAVKPAVRFEGNTAMIATYDNDGDATFNVTVKEVQAPEPSTTFTWTFIGAEGLSITYNGQAAEYADGRYTITNSTEGWENYYTVTVAPASDELSIVNVVLNDAEEDNVFEPVGASGVVNVPTSALAAQNLTFTVNTAEKQPGETTGTYTFVFDDASHVAEVKTVQGMTTGITWEANVMTYSGEDDLMIVMASGCTLVSVNTGAVDGPAITLSSVQGAPVVRIESLTSGESYYVTTTGPSEGIPSDAYVFYCPADVLEFDFGYSSAPAGFGYTYANGRYTVAPIPTGPNYQYYYLSVKVKSEFASQYTIESVSSGNQVIIPQGGSPDPQIGIYYYPAPMEWTVNFAGSGPETEYQGFSFAGENFTVTYGQVEWSDRMIPASEIDINKGTTVFIAAADGYEIVNVTDEAGREYTPEEGRVQIPIMNYASAGYVQKFNVTTQESAKGETLTFTAELLTGNPYTSIYAGLSNGGDFSDSNVRTIVTNSLETIYILTVNGVAPYQVVVDGKTVPTDMWDYNTALSQNCYTLAPGTEYYPQNNGRVEIYGTKPATSKYNVTFTFANEGTTGFLSMYSLNTGLGFNTRILPGEEEFTSALENGLSLNEGNGIKLAFNTLDYQINDIRLNGTSVVNGLVTEQGETTYTVEDIDRNLTFEFDVTLLGGSTVNFDVTGYFEQVYVIDRNYAGESDVDRYYTLSEAQTSIDFGRSVEEIKVVAKDGYEIAPIGSVEHGVQLTYADGTTEVVAQGSYFTVSDGLKVEFTVTKLGTAAERVFTFYSKANVINFTYPDSENGYAETALPATWNAPAQEGEMGYYTLTNVPAKATSLYINVNEDARGEYELDYVQHVESGSSAYAASPYVSTSIGISQITGNATFNIAFREYVAPVYVTIEVNNPSCISRIYGSGYTLTAFPAEVNLNEVRSLTVEVRDNCTLNDVTINGQSVLKGMTIDLTDAVEGDVVMVDVSSNEGDYIYTFTGPEGLSISYHAIEAEFVDGQYVVSNVYAASKNDFQVIISVADGYENNLKLVSVTDGTTTWEPTGASGIIYIPGSELPAKNTTFRVETSTPAPSETVRTVYLTIDNVSAVISVNYQGGSSEYLTFPADGVLPLEIRPDQFEVAVATSKAVTKITTDVEGTVVLPALPATRFILDLTDAVEGQTISLYVDYEPETIQFVGTPEVTVSDNVATVTVGYRVTEGLVGEVITVDVDGVENTTFTPQTTDGTVEVEISLEGLEDGNYSFEITLSAGEDVNPVSTTVNITVSGIFSVFADEEGNVEIYNLNGVKVNNSRNLTPGFYIVNGRKVYLNR